MDKIKVDLARCEAEEAYKKLCLAKDTYLKAEEDYLKKSRNFRQLDYELAKEDGRLKKIPNHEPKKKVKKQPELSLQDILSIADKLGVKLTVEEPDEEIEALESEEPEMEAGRLINDRTR